eukprot:237301_1
MTRRQSRQFNRRSLVSKKLSMPVIPEVAPGSSDLDVELSFKPISISAESSRETEEREKMREEQVRQNLINKQKQLEREAAEQAHQLELEEEKRIEKLKKELKGKSYTLDQDGNVVVINPVKTSKLPDFSVSPAVDISATARSTGGGGLDKRALKAAKATRRARKKAKEPPKTAAEFVKSTVSVQPPISDNIKLCPGVGVVDGGSSLAGPEAEVSEKTMTRLQYNDFLKTFQDAKRETHVVDELDEEPTFSPKAHVPVDTIQPLSPRDGKSTAVGGSEIGSTMTHATHASTLSQRMTRVQRFNAALLTDPHWGRAGVGGKKAAAAAQPRKPSRSQLADTLGQVSRPPRQRPKQHGEVAGPNTSPKKHVVFEQPSASKNTSVSSLGRSGKSSSSATLSSSASKDTVTRSHAPITRKYQREFVKNAKPSVIKTTELG